MTLATLPIGQHALITQVLGEDGLRTRMFALGLRVGREVVVVRRARGGGPLQIRVGNTDLIMRHSEARLIQLDPNPPRR
jgi:ferrous iron transport protein A